MNGFGSKYPASVFLNQIQGKLALIDAKVEHDGTGRQHRVDKRVL
jgi:hypothetical protein